MSKSLHSQAQFSSLVACSEHERVRNFRPLPKLVGIEVRSQQECIAQPEHEQREEQGRHPNTRTGCDHGGRRVTHSETRGHNGLVAASKERPGHRGLAAAEARLAWGDLRLCAQVQDNSQSTHGDTPEEANA